MSERVWTKRVVPRKQTTCKSTYSATNIAARHYDYLLHIVHIKVDESNVNHEDTNKMYKRGHEIIFYLIYDCS